MGVIGYLFRLDIVNLEVQKTFHQINKDLQMFCRKLVLLKYFILPKYKNSPIQSHPCTPPHPNYFYLLFRLATLLLFLCEPATRRTIRFTLFQNSPRRDNKRKGFILRECCDVTCSWLCTTALPPTWCAYFKSFFSFSFLRTGFPQTCILFFLWRFLFNYLFL